MSASSSHDNRGEKRARQELVDTSHDAGPHSDRSKRRRKSDYDGQPSNQSSLEKTSGSANATTLMHLPVELLYNIHLCAKNPSFVLLNRRTHAIFSACPTSIKARYLLARWHEAYCYGFTGALPRRHAQLSSIPNRPPLPYYDLLENGALAELTWTSRLLPVLPASEIPYPLSNSLHRSADHFVLDYCLRYRLTNLDVLHACEEMILRLPEFGNIVAATGLWRDASGLLHSHEPRRPTHESEHDEDSLETSAIRPVHLRITELPKRLFQHLKTIQHEQDQSQAVIPDVDTETYMRSFDPKLRRYLYAFGNGMGPFPSHDSLMLLLSVAALHVPMTTTLPAASAPFNSYEGLPLAKATFAKSAFMVQLLLALGAESTRKGGLSLYIAIRSGWLDGLQQLVERDEAKLVEWQNGLEGIRVWFAQREGMGRSAYSQYTNESDVTNTVSEEANDESIESPSTSNMTNSPHRLPKPVLGGANGNGRTTSSASSLSTASLSSPSTILHKRRRLLDRANVDTKMLKEAVKHNRWPVANWLRAKGIVPDLRTIKLIEMKQMRNENFSPQSPGHSSSSAERK